MVSDHNDNENLKLWAPVHAARAVSREASIAFAAVKREHDAEHHARLAEFEKALQSDLATKYGEKLRAASDALAIAKAAEDAAEVARGETRLAAMGDPRRVEWRNKGTRWSGFSYEPTAATGTLEVCRPGTVFPENMKWQLPSVGEIFLRKNRANGQPGIQIVARAELDRDWKPLDWTPEKQKAQA